MVEYAGIAIFVFGNKKDEKGNIVPSNGMRQEFDLCVKAGVRPLPVGATGFVAEELWQEVRKNLDRFYPKADATFRLQFDHLGDSSKAPDELISIVVGLIDKLQKT
jgi:hypothetical protein